MSGKVAIKNNIIIPGVENDLRSNERREVLDICSDEESKKAVEEKDAKIVEFVKGVVKRSRDNKRNRSDSNVNVFNRYVRMVLVKYGRS